MPSDRAAAFFDLDKTLLEGSSAFYFARAAFESGMLSRRQLARDLVANLAFRLRGSTDEQTEAVKRRVLDAIAGQRQRDLMRLGPRVLSSVLPRLYPQMLEEAWSHQEAGRKVYIVTAAAQELADALAHVLGFDGAVGMRAEVEGGVYTGRLAGPFTYREGKAEAIRELAVREGFDLERSFAYSDSESDLPMLRAVGNPVAVNPDKELERIARAEGWRIMRFDRLALKLRLGAALATAAAGGACAALVVRRARPRRRWRVLARV